MKPKIMVLNGPNLNMLGTRQPEIYGHDTLADIEGRLRAQGSAHGIDLEFRQTNYEGGIVDLVQEARETCAGLIINPAAYTHTSLALADALATCAIPIIELHLSNPHKREEFRKHSFVSPVATGVMFGFGALGYELAFEGMVRLIQARAGGPEAK